MRTTTALLGTGALFAATAGLALPASAQDSTAAVSVLHGIPGLTVDVYVNDDLTLDDFEPGDLAGPLDLPAGSYEVDITASDAADNSSPVLSATLDVAAGGNYTAVAHLTEGGDPTVTPFVNDTEAAGAGEGKLTARHTAQAPEVTVFVDGGEVASFTNPNEISAPLPAGEYDVELQAGGAAVATTPSTDAVPVQEGVNTIAYAWGTAEDLQIAVQTVNLGHSAPSGVPGGESGMAAASNAGWLYAAAAAGIVGIAVAGRRLATSAK
jgi:hypothetical protein